MNFTYPHNKFQLRQKAKDAGDCRRNERVMFESNTTTTPKASSIDPCFYTQCVQRKQKTEIVEEGIPSDESRVAFLARDF